MIKEAVEKEPEIVFEHDCPIEEVAALTWEVHAEKHDLPENSTPQGSVERIKSFLARPNVTELVLRRDGELIGCNFSFEESEEELKKEVPHANFFTRPGERVFLLKGLNIKLKYRGQGFGQMLMERTMDETRRKGATKLILSIPEKDPAPAKKMYEKLGFREVAPNQHERSFYMQYEYPIEKNVRLIIVNLKNK